MHEIFQIYWWCVVSLLGGILVFMLFVQGGQTLLFTLAKNETEKDFIINSIGKKWELTFTTLVMFGGACFAAFPLFYATSFGGAYWAWMALLFCFIIQAVAYEYRKKPDNFLGAKTYEAFLFINGSLGTILLGIIVSTLFSGSEFALGDNNFVQWKSSARGLEALANPFNYILGVALFFCARTGANLYLMNNIAEPEMIAKLKASLKFNASAFLVFFIAFLAWVLLKQGYAIGAGGVVSLESFKYLHNYLSLPAALVLLLLGVVMVLVGIFKGAFTSSVRGIFFYGVGVVCAVTSVFLILGLNHTAFYPSNFDLQSSLSISNASSSLYTLKTMFYVSFLVPFVLGYISYVWRAMDAKKLDKEGLSNEHY
ncbi:MAG: cytochrome d ubiquinol oxidase subunit II [Campylobacter sp.]|nr:cytochrome d ubiquinol oxidase subunit II [uncultured Campylobacter sp.]